MKFKAQDPGSNPGTQKGCGKIGKPMGSSKNVKCGEFDELIGEIILCPSCQDPGSHPGTQNHSPQNNILKKMVETPEGTFNLSEERKKLFDIMLREKPTPGRIYRIIKKQDKTFIQKLKEMIIGHGFVSRAEKDFFWGEINKLAGKEVIK